MVGFHTPISLLKLYGTTVTERFKIHAVVNALGSVVDKYMYTVPSLNNACRVSELEQLTLAY